MSKYSHKIKINFNRSIRSFNFRILNEFDKDEILNGIALK